MTLLRSVLIVLTLCVPILGALTLGTPTQAAEVVYPAGSRVGLAPPSGLTVSRHFSGFEDRDRRAALLVVTLPAVAFADIEASSMADVLLKQGVTVEQREELSHPLGKALLVKGHQQIDGQRIGKWIFVLSTGDITALVTAQIPDAAKGAYSDAVIRAAFDSVAVRAQVPVEEQLGLVPFRLGELAGFRIGGVIAGRAVMLTDGAPAKPATAVDTHVLIAIAAGGPAQASERGRFAHEVFETLPNLKGVRIESSEVLRIGGQPGHQIMARGRDAATGDEITMVQWLRFSGAVYLQVIGVARSAGWTEAYARFRQVRDGIDLR